MSKEFNGGPGMSLNFTEQRTGPRYLVHINVRAEWDDERSGEHVVVEGETENIGPQGALVRLERLPDVGSRVHLIVPDAEGKTLETVAAALTLERNPVQPLAALQRRAAPAARRALGRAPAGLR